MPRTARLLDVDYRRDPLRVRLHCVGDDGYFIAVDHDFAPYFYVLPAGDAGELQERLQALTVDDGDTTIAVRAVQERGLVDGREERPALQVVAAEPPDVPKLRDAVTEWETVADTRAYDIPFYKRYLIDNGIAPTDWLVLDGEADGDRFVLETPPEPADDGGCDLSVLAFDLEVIDDEIIMCSVYGDGVERVLVTHDDGWDAACVEVVDDEAALIDRFVALVQEHDPDVVTGYNTDEFDFDVLQDRAAAHGVDLPLGRDGAELRFQRRGRFAGAQLDGRVHLDLYAFVANVVSIGMRSDTLTLEAVAAELLGERKDDVSWDEMKRWWREKEQLDTFAAYALRDAELAFKLGESLIPQILSLSSLTGLPPFDTCRHAYGQLVEHYLLRQAQAEGQLPPNRPTQSERGRRYASGQYAGGFVYEPEKGLYEDIALFDFRSLYPTIIVAHNISPDTLDVDDCADELTVELAADASYTFCQDEPGFIPGILEELVSERYELKAELAALDDDSQAYLDMDARQNALKILANAFYGYMGYSGARWYSRPCAAATTQLGREYIRETIDIAREQGFEIVYGDTDSVFITGADVRAQADAFLDTVNDELPGFMELEFEGFYPRGLFTYTESGEGAKKKYALLGADGSVKITGFEQVRRDWSQLAKDVQETVIERVLQDDVDGAVQAVQDAINELEAGDVDLHRLKIHTQLTKKPESYESTAPHVAAAKKAIRRGKTVEPGDVLAYVVTRGPGTISDRAELVDYAEEYDPQYYVEKQVIPVALRVLKVFGYTADQLLGKGKQTGLDSFG